MHLELAAVVAGDLDLVAAAGAVPIVSLDLSDGSATHSLNSGALGLLGVGTGDLLLRVAAVGVGDPGSAESYQHRYRHSYHQRLYVYSVFVHYLTSLCFIGSGA